MYHALLVVELVLRLLKVNLKLAIVLGLLDQFPQGLDLLLLVVALICKLDDALIQPDTVCAMPLPLLSQLHLDGLVVVIPLQDLGHELVEFHAVVLDFLFE